MPIACKRVFWFVVCFAIALSSARGPIVHAQTTPKIESLFPPGAQRGTEVEVQFVGEFMPEACRLTLAGDGVALRPSVVADRYRFSVTADAAVGPREVRLSSVQGASPPFPFLIGELPEIIHAEKSEPQVLKFPVTANGRLDFAGDIDEYAVALPAGSQIVCAVTARAIRSPVDAMLRLLDADGKPVAASFPHRSADALLVFRAPTAGSYTLQVFDFQMSGGAEFIYRLTVTDGPWLNYVFPAGLSREVESPVTVHGWNLPAPRGDSLVLRILPQPAGRHELTLPGCANRLTLPVGENAEQIEAEPNNVVEQATLLPFPATMNGRLSAPGDVDVFAFTAKKGERFAIEVDSADLQFSTDLVLAVVSEAGKTLVEVDDVKTSRDPNLRFAVPADGRYFVSLRDRSRDGGEQYVYRLHLTALRPDVTARVNTSSLMVHSGQTVSLPVLVERIDGLSDELEVAAVDLPVGVEVKPQPVPAKTPATVQLPFTVAEKTFPVGGLVRILVRNTKTGESSQRAALIAESAGAASDSGALWLAVSPEIPFTLQTAGPILDAPRLAGFPFPVSVVRKAGFTGPVRLVGVEPDRRGTLVPLAGQIAAGSDAGSIPLVLQHKVTEGTTHRCRVMGVAEVPGNDGKMYAVFHVAAGSMSIGCQPSLLTLTALPGIVVWRPGETQRVEVRLMRRVAMQPITLRLALPDGVVGIECQPVEAAIDQDRVELTLRFSPTAMLPPRATIEIKAESSRDGLPIYGTTSFRLESP